MQDCWRLGLLLALLCSVHGQTATADDVDPALALQRRVVRVTAQVEPAMVSIVRVIASAESPLPADFDPFRPLRLEESGPVADGFGSGVILKVEGSTRLLILTNHHVVTSRAGRDEAQTDRLYVRTIGGHTLPATLRAFDPRSDLAVLEAELTAVTADVLKIIPPQIGSGEDLHKGDFVLALGNPWSLARDGSCSVAAGMVGNRARRPLEKPDQDRIDSAATIHELGTLLQLDMRLPLGMSGGALVNLQGELVGLTTSLAALQGDPTAAGFAIPMTPGIRRIVESLLKGEEVEYGFLGVDPDDGYPEDLRPARPFITQATAARVGRVALKSPAALAGLEEGDQVYAVGEVSIRRGSDLVREIGLLGPGAVAVLKVFRPRNRQMLTLEVALGKWPVYDDRRLVVTHPQYPSWRGLRVDYPTGRFRYLPDSFLSVFPEGVVITDVVADSPAALAQLKPGMTIRQVAGEPVKSPAAFYAAVAASKEAVSIQLAADDLRVVPEE